MTVHGATRCVAVALVGLVLAGCASVPAGTFDRTVHGETIEGRIAIHYKDLATDREDASSGHFVWTTSGDELELSLLDPLGQTVALVRSDARHSSITFRDGHKVEGDTPEQLTQRTLGWTVPLRGLRFWLTGRADPSRPVTMLADGRLCQDNWTIGFERGSDDHAGAPADPLPKRIDLHFPGPPAAVELRLVVDSRSAS
jgi:outer membrane lipoprotein LolB